MSDFQKEACILEIFPLIKKAFACVALPLPPLSMENFIRAFSHSLASPWTKQCNNFLRRSRPATAQRTAFHQEVSLGPDTRAVLCIADISLL